MRIPALLLLLVAVGCGPPDLGSRLERYAASVVERGESAEPGEDSVFGPLPRVRDRRLPVGETRIGVVDFLAVQGCRLGVLAGFRNSPLGRVMGGTRRLVYELEVLEVAGDCLVDMEPERRDRLGAQIDGKRAELGAHVWNAVWTAEELESFLSTSITPAPFEPERDPLSALVAAARVVARPPRSGTDGEVLERALGDLRGAPPAGRLLRDLDLSRHYMERVAAHLRARDASGCDSEARRLTRAFEASLDSGLHVELARLDRETRPLLEALDELYVATRGAVSPPDAMERYHATLLQVDNPDGLWMRYRQATLDHARAWQPTLEACGFLPETDGEVEAAAQRAGAKEST